MKTYRKFAGIACGVIILFACLGAGVTGLFTQVNSTNGYQVNGVGGSAGNLLCSDGTYFSLPCALAQPPFSISGSTITLADSGVTVGNYTNPNFTVNRYGQITAANNGSVDQYGSLTGCSFPNDGGGLHCDAGSITWGTPFADTSYTANCSINFSSSIAGGSSTQPVIILNWTPTSTTAMSIIEGVAQGSSGGYGVDSRYGVTVYCHAHHA